MNVLILEDCTIRAKYMRKKYPGCVIVRHAYECIEKLMEHAWHVVSLDHDLNWQMYVDSNDPDCGMEVVRWLEKHFVSIGKVIIHSANKEAAQEMYERLENIGHNVTIDTFRKE